jgi:hypothetical protein
MYLLTTVYYIFLTNVNEAGIRYRYSMLFKLISIKKYYELKKKSRIVIKKMCSVVTFKCSVIVSIRSVLVFRSSVVKRQKTSNKN